jgi:mannose/fructose/N-acetylgalactosamine-specific phosphotransferase system component IID
LIEVGAPQGSVLGPVLYLLYINDVPTALNSTMAMFVDDTAVMAIGETVENSTRKLQSAVNKVAVWTKKKKQ